MKKMILIAAAALSLAACSKQKSAETTAETAATDTVAIAGNFEVRPLASGAKLHIYLTGDEMADASFIIEGADSLITLEQPLFKVNADAFDAYLAGIAKPVAHRISDYHLGNTGVDTIIMPEGMPAVVKGEAYSGMMQHFAQVYGDAIVALPTGETEEVTFDVPVELAGINFTFLHGASNDFPGANILIGTDVVYSHWAPAKAHINTLYAADIEGIDARLTELEQILATGATIFVGGHGAPATADDVRFRIEYLNKIKELKSTSADAATFSAALIEAYPGLPGEDGVESLAKSLYGEQA